MPPIKLVAAGNVTLVDALDHLLDRGAVLLGDATLSVADVDLVYVGINLLVSSVETMRQRGEWPGDGITAPRQPLLPSSAGDPGGDRSTEAWQPESSSEQREGYEPAAPGLSLQQPAPPVYQLLNPDGSANDGTPQRSLVRLVLALVELLRQLVERQALRRMEGGGLSDDQVERMGEALKSLSEKVEE